MGELRLWSYTIRCRYSKLYSANRPAGLWPAGRFLSFPAVWKIFFTFFSAESGFARKTCAAERSVSGKGKYHRHPQTKGGEKMETNPRDYGKQCRFDAFCKTVLKHVVLALRLRLISLPKARQSRRFSYWYILTSPLCYFIFRGRIWERNIILYFSSI